MTLASYLKKFDGLLSSLNINPSLVDDMNELCIHVAQGLIELYKNGETISERDRLDFFAEINVIFNTKNQEMMFWVSEYLFDSVGSDGNLALLNWFAEHLKGDAMDAFRPHVNLTTYLGKGNT